MAAGAFDLTRNLSLYTLPAAFAISLLPHTYAITLGKFDNRSPRTYAKAVEADQSLDRATKDKIIRAEAASANGFETLGFFAAAVVAGNVAKLDNWTLNALSFSYLASRLAFVGIYINNTTDSLALARTASWFSGIGVIFTLFIKSGNAVKDHL